MKQMMCPKCREQMKLLYKGLFNTWYFQCNKCGGVYQGVYKIK